MRVYNDDSTGKKKVSDARTRSAALSAVFILGICLGVVVAEKMYINMKENSAMDTLQSLRNNKLELAENTSSIEEKDAYVFVRDRAVPRNELEKLLQEIAPDGEVMIVISNMNLIHSESLKMWIECAQLLPSKHWLVVAIDEELATYCTERGIPHYYRPVKIPKSQKKTGDNHAISAMKYEIIHEFLVLGWSTLLSDADIVIVQDPFQHLYRDHDLEGMSDGFNADTAYGVIYGVDDPSMGWSRYAQGVQHMALNSGLFYLRANERTVELMQRIADRLHVESSWDQSVYNQEIFFLSHGEVKSPQVSVRVMEIEKFMNSKVLFKYVRWLSEDEQTRPVMVHMNYHPDKTDRMKAAIKYYLQGDKGALEPFPGGSEPGSR